MKKLRIIALITVSLVTLIIITLVSWLFQLDQKVKDGLAQKKFLPPTQYFSSSYLFETQVHPNKSLLLKTLFRKNYLQQTEDKVLQEGQFTTKNQENCLKDLPSGTTQEFPFTCLYLKTKPTLDPQLKGLGLQIALFDATENLQKVFSEKENVLTEATEIVLEPDLVAQYIEQKPIMQNYVPLGEIPTHCLNSVLSIEDAHFLEHSGISYTGFARAVLKNVILGRAAQGGSTITQQMVKNYFLTSEKTLKRKATELFMSFILESHANKDEILETYLNIIYLGQNGTFQIRGFGAAAQFYFQKPLNDLNLPECSLLAAVLNSPGLYDPFKKPENSLKRRKLVLDKMLELQKISETEYKEALEFPLPSNPQAQISETAPYYIDAVNKQIERLGIQAEGSDIYTGLNLEAQRFAQLSVQNGLGMLQKKLPAKINTMALESFLLSLNNKNQMIEAVVGGKSFKMTQFNRAIDSKRQVGSIFKPIVYLKAIEVGIENENRYNPLSAINDQPITFSYQNQKWTPENYGKKYYKDIPLFFALTNSLNVSTAKLGMELGLKSLIELAHRLGVESDLKEVPSLSLGSFEMLPIEVIKIYSTFAQMGLSSDPSFISSVVHPSGQIIYHFQPSQVQVVTPEAAAMLLGMLRQNNITGTGRAVQMSSIKTDSAGKTGTTSDYKDAWYAGVTPIKTVVTWVGFDNNQSHGLTGASGALPIWIQYLSSFAESASEKTFVWPDTVTLKKFNLEVPVEAETIKKSKESDNEDQMETKEFELIFRKDFTP